MKPSMVTATLPQFEYAYRHGSLHVSPVKYDNLASTTAAVRLLEEVANSTLTVEAGGAAAPSNPAPRLLSEGYATVLHS